MSAPQLQHDSSLFPPCHIPQTELHWWGTEWVRLNLVCGWGESVHTCVCVCVAEGKSSICVCSWCWTRPLVADSIFRGRREEQDRRRRRRAFISLFFFSCWRKCQHASVCLPTGQKRKKNSYIPADSCQRGKKAVKKGRQEVAQKKKGGGSHLVLNIHHHTHSTGGMREPPRRRTGAPSVSWSLS